MPELPPTILDGQSFSVVMDRVRAHSSLAGLRSDPDSNVYRMLSPSVLEINNLYRECQRVLEMTSVLGEDGHRAAGAWLDQYVTQMSSLSRVQATQAEVPVRFTGTTGTVIHTGYTVIAPGTNPLRFDLIADVTIGLAGTGDGTVRAQVAGTSGNVAVGAISQLTTTVAGLTAVTNLAGPSVTGFDEETDQALINRFLSFMRDQPNGSNPAQYEQWAREVAGIGNAVVLRPGETNGPTGSRLDLYVVDTDMEPAGQELVDAVLDYISPPRVVTREAETVTVFNANGVSVDATQVDDSGDSQKMVYSAAGQGELRYNPTTTLVQAGVWTVRPRMKVNSIAGAVNLVTIEAYNLTTAAMLNTRETGGVPATITLHANNLLLAYSQPVLQFYWNGTDNIEVRVRRINTDTTTQLWVDYLTFQSMFSSYDLRGKANATAEVHAYPAIAHNTAVAVNVKLADNAVQADTVQAIRDSVIAYYQEIALRPDDIGGNDLIYGEIGARVQDSAGVAYYDPASLRLDGGTANVVLDKRTVAIPDPTTAFTIGILP